MVIATTAGMEKKASRGSDMPYDNPSGPASLFENIGVSDGLVEAVHRLPVIGNGADRVEVGGLRDKGPLAEKEGKADAHDEHRQSYPESVFTED
jgi:hypothetical protein